MINRASRAPTQAGSRWAGRAALFLSRPDPRPFAGASSRVYDSPRVPIFLEDRPLLDAFRRGLRDALERVYRFYLDDVLRMVRLGFVAGQARFAGVRERDAQMDLTQDIFVKAFREPARLGYDGVRPYRPYLIRIGRNHLIDRVRQSGPEIELDDLPEDAIALEPEPEEDIDWRRLRTATQAFIADQPEEMRTFVELRFVEDCSQAEIAKKMKVTRRRVRTLESRALDGLARHLEQAGLTADLEAREASVTKNRNPGGPKQGPLRKASQEAAS